MSVIEACCDVEALGAYFDDSGTHAGSDAVAVAGYISTPERWLAFESAWRLELAHLGLEMFHMSQFAVGAGPYKRWSEPQRRIRLGRLIEIINAHVIGSVGNVIPTKLYEATFGPEATRHVGGPYGLAATVNFMSVGETLDGLRCLGHDPWVEYVFESGTLGYGQIMKVFQYNEQDPEQKAKLGLLSLDFENKRDSVALQAAGILAYELGAGGAT